MNDHYQEDVLELNRKLGVSIKLHWVFPLILLALTFTAFSEDEYELPYFYPVLWPAALVYACNVFLAVFTVQRHSARNARALLTLQFGIDVIMTTVMVQSYVGVDSVFTFLYPLIIVMAGLFVSSEMGLLMATMSSVLYAGLMLLGYYNLTDSPYFTETFERYFNLNREDFIYLGVAVKIIFFHVIALTAGSLKKILDATRDDLVVAKLETDMVITNIPAGVIAIDMKGTITRINDRGRTLLTRLNCLAQLGDEYRHVLPEKFAQYLDKALSSQMVCNAKFTLKRRQEYYYFDIQAAPIKRERTVLGGILIFNDVTGMVSLRRQLDRSKQLTLVGKMSANIAFGVRNPIRSALRYAEVIKSRQEQAKIYLGESTMLSESLKRADAALSRILELSQTTEYTFARVELQKLVRLIFDARVDELSKKMIRWKVDIGDDAVRADSAQLTVAFNRLIDNSLDAMPNGGELRISVAEQEKDAAGERWVSIRVSDSGKGVPTHIRSRIFDPFVSSHQRGHEGLGLTIAAKIVDDHGGYLMLEESEPGLTVFLISWKQREKSVRRGV